MQVEQPTDDLLEYVNLNKKGLTDSLNTLKSKYSDQLVNINGLKSAINSANDILTPDLKNASPENIANSFMNNISSFPTNRGQLNLQVDNKDVKGKHLKGGSLAKLMALVRSFMKLPRRFADLSKALVFGGKSFGLGIGGFFKSVGLAGKDIYILISAIVKVIVKYALCFVSFIVTTIMGCFFVHIISFIFIIVRMVVIFLIEKITGEPQEFVNAAFDKVSWPDSINKVCYTCFGKNVKISDLPKDLRVVQDIGDMIKHDFNVKMPRYMRPAKPPGRSALKSLDKAIN